MPGHAPSPFDFEYASYGLGERRRHLPVSYISVLVALEFALAAAIWLCAGDNGSCELASRAFSVIMSLGSVFAIVAAVVKDEHSKYLWVPVICLGASAFLWASAPDPFAVGGALWGTAIICGVAMAYAIWVFVKRGAQGLIEEAEVSGYVITCVASIVVVAVQALFSFPLGMLCSVVSACAIAVETIVLAGKGEVGLKEYTVWPLVERLIVFAPLCTVYVVSAFGVGADFDVPAAFLLSSGLCTIFGVASIVAFFKGDATSLDAVLFGVTGALFLFNMYSGAAVLAGMHAILLSSIIVLEACKFAFLFKEALEEESEEGTGMEDKENTVGWKSATNAATDKVDEVFDEATERAPEPEWKEIPDFVPSREMAAFWTLVGMTIVVLGIVLFANPLEAVWIPAFLPAILIIAGCVVTAFGASRSFFVDDEEDGWSFEDKGVAEEVPVADEVSEEVADKVVDEVEEEAAPVAGEIPKQAPAGEEMQGPDPLSEKKTRMTIAEILVLAAFSVCALVSGSAGIPALCVLLGIASLIPLVCSLAFKDLSVVEGVTMAFVGVGLASVAANGVANNPGLEFQIFLETLVMAAAFVLIFRAVADCVSDCAKVAEEGGAPDQGQAEVSDEEAAGEEPVGSAFDAVSAKVGEILGDAGEGEAGEDSNVGFRARVRKVCETLTPISLAGALGTTLFVMACLVFAPSALKSAAIAIGFPILVLLVMVSLVAALFGTSCKDAEEKGDSDSLFEGLFTTEDVVGEESDQDGEEKAQEAVEGVAPSEVSADEIAIDSAFAAQALLVVGLISGFVACLGGAAMLMGENNIASYGALIIGGTIAFVCWSLSSPLEEEAQGEGVEDAAAEKTKEEVLDKASSKEKEQEEDVDTRLQVLAEMEGESKDVFAKAAFQIEDAVSTYRNVLAISGVKHEVVDAVVSLSYCVVENGGVIADAAFIDPDGKVTVREDSGIAALLDANDELLDQLDEIYKALVRNGVSEALEKSSKAKEQAAEVLEKLGKHGF